MMMAQVNEPMDNQSWYEIKAKGKNQAEIAIYDEIGGWGITAKQFASEFKALGDNIQQLDIHIHSPGGSVFDGIAIYNLLNNHPANKTVYIDGLAASMASVIAMVGHKVIMPENAMMMIHKPWGIQGGDADDMRKYAELLDKLEATLLPAYAKKTGKSHEKLAEMLAVETWLNGAEAVAEGFADELAEPIQAMASIKSKLLKDYTNMPKAIETLITPKAQATTPNQTGANEPSAMPAASVTPPAASVPAQPATQAPSAMEALAKRNADIQAAFAPFASTHGDLLTTCLADVSMTVEQAKNKLLERLGAGTTPSTPSNMVISAHVGNGNIVGDSVKASLLARTGYEKEEQGNAYNGMTLRELARASLQDRGIRPSSNPMEMVALAFTHTSSDFGSILLDIANKSVLEGWNTATENYESFTTKGSVTDFRPHRRVGLEGFGSLPEVGEGEEYSYGTAGNNQVDIAIATYGQLFSITRQAIINDDLGLLTTIPMMMGKAAKATIAKLVFAQITKNAKWQDGKVLFDAARKNSLSNAKLDAATIAQMITAMNSFVDAAGEPLDINPEFLLAPTSLYFPAKQILESASVAGADTNSGVSNPIRGLLEPIKSPRLQAADAKSWYGINKRAIEINYLNGSDAPYIEQQQGFTVDGVVTKVRIDAGVNVIDPRGIFKVTNA